MPASFRCLRALPALLLAASFAWPAAAAELPIQGVLRTGTGAPAADGPYFLFVKLYDAPDAPVELFEATLKGVEVKNGWFDAVIGAAPAKAIPDALLVDGKPLWLGVQVGSDPELPRVPLRGVPWAYFAKSAAAGTFKYAGSDSVGGAALGLQCSGCVTGEHLADGTITASKVGFAYAGSDSKGGPAIAALTANTANSANLAKNAEKAAWADEAGGLLCTGCVQLKSLSPQAQAAFVSSTGGTIDGDLTVTQKLQVDGELALGKASITGGRFAAQEVAKAPCTLAERGQLAFDDKTGRMYLCDGKAFLRISTCSEACQDPALVACGKSVPNQCGDTGACGDGTFCAAGSTCKSGKCETIYACNPASGKKIVLTSSTSWQVPGDVTKVRVMVVGGGGGGAQGHGNGGGSGHVRKGEYTVTPCTNIAVTVGTGGVYNTAGIASSFGSFLTAQPGQAGQQNASGSGAGGSGGGGAGNAGCGGDGGTGGSAGQSGCTYGGGAGGNFDAVTTGYFKAATVSHGAGGSKGSSSHAGGGGGGGALIDGAGTGGGDGEQSWSAKGGKGYGGGGGGGGYNGPYAKGGTGGTGVVYVEWD